MKSEVSRKSTWITSKVQRFWESLSILICENPVNGQTKRSLLIKILFLVLNPCDPNPCQNGGVCVTNDEAYIYDCNCKEFFKGINCEIPI